MFKNSFLHRSQDQFKNHFFLTLEDQVNNKIEKIKVRPWTTINVIIKYSAKILINF